MVNNIGKISPVNSINAIRDNRTGKKFQSLTNSLIDNGYSRFPGTGTIITPYKEPKNGEYRTGLNPNALYIKELEIVDKELADVERKRASEKLKHFQDIFGKDFDLGPRSYFYSGIFTPEGLKEGPTTEKVWLFGQSNTFDLNDAYQALKFEWLRVHPLIAPSMEAYTKRKINPRFPNPSLCQFYVEDEKYEMEKMFKSKKAINNAVSILNELSPDVKRQVAKLLGIMVNTSEKEEIVYNHLDDFIKASSKNIELFKTITSYTTEDREIKYLIKEAIEYQVYRVGKQGNVYEGTTIISDNERELEAELKDPTNQDMLIALKEKVVSKKSQYIRR